MTIVLVAVALGAIVAVITAQQKQAVAESRARSEREMVAYRRIEELQPKADAGDMDAFVEILTVKRSVGWTF
jgi:hypothetical protein